MHSLAMFLGSQELQNMKNMSIMKKIAHILHNIKYKVPMYSNKKLYKKL